MSLETEIKNLTDAVANLTAVLANGAGATPVVTEEKPAEDPKAKAAAEKKAKAEAEAAKKKKAEADAAKKKADEEAAAALLGEDDDDGVTAPTVTRAELLNLVKSLVKAQKLAEATEILKNRGASKVSELDESDYDEVYAELKELED